MEGLLTRILNFQYLPIDWDYSKLSPKEKSFVSEEEFANLKARYHDPEAKALL